MSPQILKLVWRTIFISYFAIILINFYQDALMSAYCIGTLYICSSLIIFNSLLPKFIEDQLNILHISTCIEHVIQSVLIAGLIIVSHSAKHHLFYPMIFIFSVFGWMMTFLMAIVYMLNLFEILNMMEMFSLRIFIDMFNTSFC
jgi:hypothetical protein